MTTFLEFLEQKRLDEKLITFNNKIPKYNTVVILAGGAGSGKGFVLGKLLGIQGKVIDVDRLKEFVLSSSAVKEKIKQYGKDLSKIDFKNPDDVSFLHNVVDSLDLKDKIVKNILSTALTTNHKPNIIFDITMKSKSGLYDILTAVQNAGYQPENIHIVWVLTNKAEALDNNDKRPRKVNPKIVSAIHDDVESTVKSLFNNFGGGEMSEYGTFTVVLNGGAEKIKATNNVVTDVQKVQFKMGKKVPETALNLIRSQIPHF